MNLVIEQSGKLVMDWGMGKSSDWSDQLINSICHLAIERFNDQMTR